MKLEKLPKSRTENIVVQHLKGEVLIYDMLTHKAYRLNETLAIVYQSCDGAATFADLKRKHNFSDDFVFLALDELQKENLLAEKYESKFKGVSRREVIRKVGLATMIALPLIAGLAAPKAVHAASNCAPDELGRVADGCPCDPAMSSNDCQSLCCDTQNTQTCVDNSVCNPPFMIGCRDDEDCFPFLPVCGPDGFCCSDSTYTFCPRPE